MTDHQFKVELLRDFPNWQMTSKWRSTHADATLSRRIGVHAMSVRRHVPAGFLHILMGATLICCRDGKLYATVRTSTQTWTVAAPGFKTGEWQIVDVSWHPEIGNKWLLFTPHIMERYHSCLCQDVNYI